MREELFSASCAMLTLVCVCVCLQTFGKITNIGGWNELLAVFKLYKAFAKTFQL